MIAPVVVFAYNRKKHLKKAIEALMKADMADQTNVYVYSDAAKNDENIEKVQEVREYLDKLRYDHPFRSLNIISSEKNKGLSKSIVEGLSSIMKKYGRAIVLEDDIIVASDFLIYMNEALDFYENDHRVWSISAYVEDFLFLRKYEYQTFAYPRADCWGWGTWANRWELVDWEVKDYKRFAFSPVERYRFNRGGEDLSRMLDAQMAGAINSWAIRWCYSAYKVGMLSMHPTISRVINIGLDGSGEHCSKQDDKINILMPVNERCHMMPCELRPEIYKTYTRCMKHRYTLVYRIKKTVKNFMRRVQWILEESGGQI